MAPLVLACGALAREIKAVFAQHPGPAPVLRCLPAELHNRPQQIAPRVDRFLAGLQGRYAPVFVAYADCGTGGDLDRVLARYPGVQRLAGAHCYDAFAGGDAIADLLEAQPGSFFLTDFIVRHFERLIVCGLGLDRHPEWLALYFGNYTRVVYLAQTEDARLHAAAEAAAVRLGLAFEYRPVGYGSLRGIPLRLGTRAA